LSKAWELRATTSLARLCKQQGRRDEVARRQVALAAGAAADQPRAVGLALGDQAENPVQLPGVDQRRGGD